MINLNRKDIDYYVLLLRIGSIITSIAIFFPVISVRNIYTSGDLGVSVYFWSFLFGSFYMRFSISPFVNTLFLLNLVGVIYIGYIAIFIKKRKRDNKKFMSITFSTSILMIVSILNWIVLIEFIYLLQQIQLVPLLETLPGSIWWDYTPNFGMIGMIIGATIIIFCSLYEMNKLQSWYFYAAIGITCLFIIYLAYSIQIINFGSAV